MSTWPKWAQTIGNASPFLRDNGTPFTNPMEQTANTASFYARAIPLLNEFVSLVKADLTARGFRYTTLDHAEGTDVFTTGLTWYERAAAEKNGVTVEYLFQWFAPRDYTPAELAAEIERRWQAAAYQGYAPPVQPAATSAPAPAPAVSAPAPAPASGPGPATTVPAGGSSSQPAQAPAAPDAGTQISAPAQDTADRKTFDVWNWEYQQRTGRAGPAPEAVGFPAERRQQPITMAEWWQYAGPWYSTGTGGTGGTGDTGPGSGTGPGGTGGTGGGNPPDSASGGPGSYFTIVAALLALLGFSTVAAGPQ